MTEQQEYHNLRDQTQEEMDIKIEEAIQQGMPITDSEKAQTLDFDGTNPDCRYTFEQWHDATERVFGRAIRYSPTNNDNGGQNQ